MIEYMVLATNITVPQAKKYIRDLHLSEQTSGSGNFSCNLKSGGIRTIGVWMNNESNPEFDRISTLFVTIQPNKYKVNGTVDVQAIQSHIDSIPLLTGINWRIQNFRFIKRMVVAEHKYYLKYLQTGVSPASLNMSRTVKKDGDVTELSYISEFAELKITNAGDMLTAILDIKKLKIKELAKKEWLAVEKRDFLSYEGKLEMMESFLWNYYLEKISGKGDYFSEEKIEELLCDNKELKTTQKKRMIDVVKGVSTYKNVESFLAHVEDDVPKYDFMKNLKKKSTAIKYMKLLDEQGINVVPISVRNSKTIKKNHLENLIKHIQRVT